MEEENDAFMNLIKEGLQPETTDEKLKSILYQFQHEVNMSKFSKYPRYKIIEFFNIIWKLLLTSSASESSTTRLAAYRATGAFLTRITPYFPEIVHTSFSDVTLQATIDVSSSAVIASSFAFISTYIAPPFLPKFLRHSPVFHHFASDNQAFSEHLAVIITHLGHLGIDWLKNLLQYFLEKLGESSSRYLIKSIAAIISHDPPLFIKIIMDYTKNNIPTFINLISFIISNQQCELENIDLSQTAISALDIIDNPNSSPADIDSAVQVLAFKSSSFNVSVDLVSDNCHITVWNDTTKKEKDVSIKLIDTKSSFYLLPLPFDYLIPKKGESLMILSSKFKSLASNPNFDTESVLNIFEPYLLMEYNTVASSALQGLTYIINRLLTDVKTNRLHMIVRKVLFSKQTSWYHSFDKLRIIKNINPALFKEKLGEKLYNELLDFIVNLCSCENDSLSNEAVNTILEYLTPNNFEVIIRSHLRQFDIFTTNLFYRSIYFMRNIIEKHNIHLIEIDLYCSQILESLFLYYDNLNILSEILLFFSIYKYPNHKLNDLIDISNCIFKSSYETITGNTLNIEINANNIETYNELIVNDINNRNVDMITESNINYMEFIEPMRSSLLFMFSLPINNEIINIANLSHNLFPLECSNYFYNNWKNIEEENKFVTLSTIKRFLNYVGNINVHSIWCRISMKEKNFLNDYRYNESKDFLKVISRYYIKNNSYSKNINATTSFVYYLYVVDNKLIDIKKFINEIEVNHRIDFVKNYKKLYKLIKEKFNDLLPNEITNEKNEIKNEIIEKDNKIEMFPNNLKVEEIQNYFVHYVYHQENVLLSLLLSNAKKLKVKLEIKNIEFPKNTIDIVAKYLAENQLDIISFDDALELAITSWRPLVVEVIKKNQIELLNALNSKEKIKKKTLISFESLLGTIKFDDNLLLKLTKRILNQAETEKRFQIVISFVTKVVSVVEKIDKEFVSETITVFDKNFNVLNDQISYILLLFAQKLPLEYSTLAFINKCFIFCGKRSPSFGRLHQILIGVSSNVKYVGRNYFLELPEIIIPFIKSKKPSKYCTGLRLVEQSNLSIPLEKSMAFLKIAIERITSSYDECSYSQPILEYSYRMIMSLFIKPNSLQYQLYIINNYYPNKLITDSTKASYQYTILILPISMKIINLNDNTKKVTLLIESLFSQGVFIQYGFRALLRWIEKVNSVDEKENILMNCLLIWLRKNHNNISYCTMKETYEWVCFMGNILKPQRVIEIICFQMLRHLHFNIIFPNLLKFYVKYKNDDNVNEFNELMDTATELVNKNYCKEALKLMQTTKNYKELIRLALFDDDCKETNEIIENLKSC